MADAAVDGDKFLENGRFEVQIQGCETSAKDCVKVRLSPVRFGVRDVSTGTNWDYRVYAPGDLQHMECEMSFRALQDHENKDIKQWHADCKIGKNIRKTITIVLHDRAKQPKRHINLQNCFPVSVDYGQYSPESQTNLTTLKVNVGFVEFSQTK
jgi:hypothetical protein